mmetsp:Transcript_12980/g.39278  ORF Transcript_12980/g.39278 Transcript_12980/m.39278 type:complete len:178 (-) Transcript_12980:313-846(-)
MMNVRTLPLCAAPGTMIAARAPHNTTSSLCSTSGRKFQVPKLHRFASLQHSCQRAERQQLMRRSVVASGLKAKEDYDSSFELAEDNRAALEGLLASDTFCAQVAKQTNQEEGRQLKYTGMLFQPTPWSINSKKGMPKEYEQYLEDSRYVFINIPPNFMFQAKIFKPSRLCAIYETAS